MATVEKKPKHMSFESMILGRLRMGEHQAKCRALCPFRCFKSLVQVPTIISSLRCQNFEVCNKFPEEQILCEHKIPCKYNVDALFSLKMHSIRCPRTESIILSQHLPEDFAKSNHGWESCSKIFVFLGAR